MSPTKRINVAAAVITAVVCIFSYALYAWATKKDPLVEEAMALQSRRVPKSQLWQVGTGADYSDEVMKGEVMLVYAVSSCEACGKELQFITRSKQGLDPKTKIFVIMSEDEQVVREYIERNGVGVPVLLDKDGSLLRGLRLRYFPSNLWLNVVKMDRAVFGFPGDSKVLMDLINS